MSKRWAALLASVGFWLTCSGYAQHADTTNCAIAVYYADAYADHYQIPRALVHAIIAQESAWNQYAISDKGAVGLMQLMPRTAARFGVVDRTAVSDNIGGGVRYLAQLDRIFAGDLRLVVAAYYCGDRNIRQRGLGYSNPDVVLYVRSVARRYQHELKLQHALP